MDVGLLRLHATNYKDAATAFYGVYQSLPLSDSRRDLASFHLAGALLELGLTQAAVEHYLEIVSSRRAPELMDKSLTALKPLYEKRLVSEGRFVEGVFYEGQYTDLSPEVADFVEYLQSLTDIRHGFSKWGRARLEVLGKADRQYSFSARYGLAVERIARKEDDAAAAELRAIVASTAEIPFEIRNKARIALGRILYEKKLYEEAWQVYSKVDSPLPLQDIVMIERAWDRVASGDQQRALGLLVGLGAPVFRDIFAPERLLIRGIALRRLASIAPRTSPFAISDDLRAGARPDQESNVAQGRRLPSGAGPSPGRGLCVTTRASAIFSRARRAMLGSIGDKPLRAHLDLIYTTGSRARTTPSIETSTPRPTRSPTSSCASTSR